MLEVNNLVAGYAGLPAIHGVTFKVEKGQIVALLGSNGAGKTTTLRAVTGAIAPHSGKVTLNGQSLIGTPIHKITGMGISMVPEGRHLFPKMTIMDNLLMGAYSIKDKNLVNQKLEEVFEIFPRIKERKNQLAGTMSGGEQQMVAIARALMSNPELLILDEPSLGIMPKLVDEIFEFIKKINKEGITIVIVEQNADKTLQFADYAYVLGNGEVVIEGTGKDLLDDPHVKQVYLGLE